MIYTFKQIRRVYSEVERTISIMIRQGEIKTEKELHDTRALMYEGVNAAIRAVAANWGEVVRWMSEIENE